MADIQVGTMLPPIRYEVDAQPMKTMAALLRDPNPIHWDVAAVEAIGLGDRVVNQGPINIGYVMNVLVAWAGGDPGALRRLTVRFRGNVFADDVVTAGGTVTAMDVADDARLVTCDVWLDREGDGARVLAGTAQVSLPPDDRPS